MIKLKQINLKNIFAFIQGNFRYRMYYSKRKYLIRPHIREQIDARIYSMDSVCYSQGSCKLCGCKTTALQMANKACDKPCYPAMLSKKRWNLFKDTGVFVEKKKHKDLNEYLVWNLIMVWNEENLRKFGRDIVYEFIIAEEL